jgi:hypothetical protein
MAANDFQPAAAQVEMQFFLATARPSGRVLPARCRPLKTAADQTT